MTNQVINAERQKKRRTMRGLGLKTGKQYRKWVKEKRREAREK